MKLRKIVQPADGYEDAQDFVHFQRGRLNREWLWTEKDIHINDAHIQFTSLTYPDSHPRRDTWNKSKPSRPETPS
jgi:hypothetical protein